MTTIRAHFDGHVLVPDEPVNLPEGRSLEVQVREVDTAGAMLPERPSMRIGERDGFPVIILPPDAKPITSEDVRRALEDEL